MLEASGEAAARQALDIFALRCAGASRVAVFLIPTDEEQVIADEGIAVLGLSKS